MKLPAWAFLYLIASVVMLAIDFVIPDEDREPRRSRSERALGIAVMSSLLIVFGAHWISPGWIFAPVLAGFALTCEIWTLPRDFQRAGDDPEFHGPKMIVILIGWLLFACPSYATAIAALLRLLQ